MKAILQYACKFLFLGFVLFLLATQPVQAGRTTMLSESEPLIDINGDFTDWDNLPEAMFARHTDPEGDSSTCETDILHVSVCSDATNIYFEMRFSCDLPNPLWGGYFYDIWIDADQDPSTGFNAWGTAIGADYVWENGDLFEHIGGTTEWRWVKLGRSDYTVGVLDGARIESAIPCSAVGLPACQPYLSESAPLRFVASVMSGSSFLDMTPDDPTSGFHQWPALEVIMELPAGWSMISLPVRPNIATVTTLFPEAVVMYKYQREEGYVLVQAEGNLEVGMGYWILLDSPQSYTLKGSAITKYTMPVEDQWYMIGGCSFPAQQKMVTNGSIDVIYGYTQGVGYERIPGSEPLEPGTGCWIKFSNTPEGTEFTASTQVSQ
jgi:hypothetical protein